MPTRKGDMCGIAGLARLSPAAPPPDPALLRAMARTLRHRGPEGQGFFVAPRVGLAHTRLAIIDLAGGAQPMANEDGAVRVVFNGEIFNYLELRDELEARGHRFRTRSDTEVLVHLYEEEGPGFVRRLNGQFAFALYDARRELLLLGRDDVGILPLFYTRLGRDLLFASEVHAFAAHPDFRAAPDALGLTQLFTFWAPVPPRTVWQGVQELPPGRLLFVEKGRCRLRRWSPPPPSTAPVDPEEAAARVRAALTEAVRLRLRADVPVAAYVSGGLDSAVTAALAARFVGKRLETFGLTFAASAFNERDHQEILVRTLGLRHQRVHVTDAAIRDLLPEVVVRAGTPLLRTAPVPLYLLSRVVREAGLKVVLTGEGADEAFLGYNIFRETRVRCFWARHPASRLRPQLLTRLYPYLEGRPGPFWAAYFRPDLTPVTDPFYSHRPRWQHGAFLLRLFTDDVRRAAEAWDHEEELVAYCPEVTELADPTARAVLLEEKLFLPGYLLSTQGDRMLMAHGVEGRFPFLDPEVLALARSLPVRLRLPGLREKALLRKAFRDLLPPAILRRPKQPYRAPGSEAILAEGQLPDYAAVALEPRALRRVGLFQPERVTQLVAKLLERVRRGGSVAPREDMAFLAVLTAQLLYDPTLRPAPAPTVCAALDKEA